MSIYFDNYIDEVGNIDKLTVSSEGFAEITDAEDLFEQFGFSRVPTDDIENGLVEFDKLEYAFTEIRIDLLEAFDNAMDRLKK